MEKPKSKGTRPRKEPKFHEGTEAAARFAAGMRHVLEGGPHPPASAKTPKKPR